MAKKPTIKTIGSGYASKALLNDNFVELRDAFENTLSLDGSTPNAMQASLDLNGNDILNTGRIQAQSISVNGQSFDQSLAAAQASATAAATSAFNAETSALAAVAAEAGVEADSLTAVAAAAAASTSETNAATSETNAANSEAAAASSEISAAADASSSAANASSASASASASATSAANALASEQSAAASRDAALTALDNFDDRYLGQKAADPTLDNDGDPLLAGALYFNTTETTMKVYEGSVWVAAYASLTDALLKVNNLSDLIDVPTARTNLGLATVASTGSYSDLTGIPSPFKYNAASGATQDLDVGTYNFFDGGTLTADTTLTFSNVPTEAKWQYTSNVGQLTTYDVGNAAYSGLSFSYTPQVGGSSDRGTSFKPDGTKMYTQAGADFYQYSLSTAWDLSTASYDSVSFSVSGQDTSPIAFFFKPDGTKMYMTGFTNKRVYQYSLSTAWDLSTASYDSVSFSVTSQGARPFGLDFKPDGTRMYTSETDNDRVYQYNLSTAWNLSTASYSGVSFNVSSQASTPYDVKFKPDGTKMYVLGAFNNEVYQYSLSTAWNPSTASYDSISFKVGQETTAASSLFFKPDGVHLYVGGGSARGVFDYVSASGASITLPSSVQNTPKLSVLANQRATYDFYTADGGTNVYLIGEEAT